MNQYQHGSDEIAAKPAAPILGGNPAAARAYHPVFLFVYEALFVAFFNMLNSWLVAWVIFHHRAIIPVWGPSGIVVNSFPSSFVPAFLITLASTGVIRRRIARWQRHEPVSPSKWPLIAKLPAVLWRRAVAIGIGAAIPTVLITMLCFLIAKPVTLDFRQFMETQMVQACILGLIVGPVITARALIEPLRHAPDRK